MLEGGIGIFVNLGMGLDILLYLSKKNLDSLVIQYPDP